LTPKARPKVSSASTMRASISTWRTGMSILAIILDLFQLARDVGHEELVGARLEDDAAARTLDRMRVALPPPLPPPELDRWCPIRPLATSSALV
jgi:hypothetical protein